MTNQVFVNEAENCLYWNRENPHSMMELLFKKGKCWTERDTDRDTSHLTVDMKDYLSEVSFNKLT